ncbi:MAG: Dickkopf N-terminal cysteine-rich domain-containing protein [Pseudomonadota bacterium]
MSWRPLVPAFGAMLWLAGCPPQSNVIYCNTSRECPAANRCVDGRCQLFTPPADAAAADGVILDASRPDATRLDSTTRDRASSGDAAASDHALGQDRPTDASAGDGTARDDASGRDALTSPDSAALDAQPTDAGSGDTGPQPDASVATDALQAGDATWPDSATADAAGTTAMSALQLCSVYLSAMQTNGTCQEQPTYAAELSDQELLQRACRPGMAARRWADDLLASWTAGRVVLDWPLAWACLEASRTLRLRNPGYALPDDQGWQQLQATTCHDFHQGAVADGEPCNWSWDCADGSACYTLTPYLADSTVCGQPGSLHASCSTAWPCAENLYCNADTCEVLKQPGEQCVMGEECASSSCANNLCSALPAPPIEVGQVCHDGDICAGDCHACLPVTSTGTARQCQHLALRGAYCRDRNDCLPDLGCTSQRCTTVGVGEVCGDASGSLCHADLFCVHAEDCHSYDGDSTACQAHAPSCVVGVGQVCNPGARTCVSSLPASGACLPDGECAEARYCDPAGQCRPLAVRTQACSSDGATAPRCGDDLVCVNGLCQFVCAVPEDCQPGDFCNSSSKQCESLPSSACTSDVQCGLDRFCDTSSNSCLATLGVGAPCSRDVQCSTEQCLADPASGAQRCAIDHVDGCIPDHRADWVRLVFLFGAVLFTARRRLHRGD